MQYQSLNCCMVSSFPAAELLPEIFSTGHFRKEIPASDSLRFNHLTSNSVLKKLILYCRSPTSLNQALKRLNKDLKFFSLTMDRKRVIVLQRST